MTVVLHRSAFLEAIQKHDPFSTAVIHNKTKIAYTYRDLLFDVARAKSGLLRITGRDDIGIAGERVAFLVENGYDYVVILLSILASNAIAVPLSASFPAKELKHIISSSEALAFFWSADYVRQGEDVMQECLGSTKIYGRVDQLGNDMVAISEVQLTTTSETTVGGMMLFTSGTTAQPKGVMLSTATLTAQAQSLIEAWRYAPSDHLLHVLPLHHIHGTVNALLTPLLAGSSIEFMFPFNVKEVWKRFATPFLQKDGKSDSVLHNPSSVERARSPISFFTAVPTIWARMLQAYPTLDPEFQKAGREAVSRQYLRLNISGSAALPGPIRDGWTEISNGNILLERYGMTEVGMALSCGLDDVDRIENSVGWPLPGVEARLWEMDEATGADRLIEHGEEIDPSSGKERQGEIQLRGRTIFNGYWRNPSATEKEFTQDGWFKTGDIAIRRSVRNTGEGKSGVWARGPAYFIQGRRSADIIKTGGEKVSALEVERELLSLPQVSECAVVGLPSRAWGQKVVAVVVLTEETKNSDNSWSVIEMRVALKSRLVGYKIPQDLEIVDVIKRNAMGKVNKNDLVPEVFGSMENIRRRSLNAQERRTRLYPLSDSKELTS